MSTVAEFPYLGVGLGLRPEHYDAILAQDVAIDWLEIISENYMIPGGKPLFYLDKIRVNYPIVMHGVSLSLGSTDPLDKNYLQQLKNLMTRVEPAWVSDHLCWTGIAGKNMHDLLPLPYTEETIDHVVARIQQVQDFLGRRILIENVSSYVSYKSSAIPEWEFINAITEKADCMILLDINNVFVSAFNHHFDPVTYLNKISVHRVKQFHLAGHSQQGNYLIDTHDAAILPTVWELYAQACQRFGKVSAMIERDDNIPPLDELMLEVAQVREIMARELAYA